jgi:hypothetical protein
MLLVGAAATRPARMLMALRRPSSGTPSHTSGGELAQTNWTVPNSCIDLKPFKKHGGSVTSTSCSLT